jgi:prepilin-type processing-associated H-X9-DG protein
LSFVANMGYMTADIWDDPLQGHRHQVSGTYNWNNGPFDENSPEDEAVSRATGVILHAARGRGVRIDDISDGQSNTLLLAENLNAGWWVSGSPHETGFAVRIGGTATQIPTAAESAQGSGAGTQETALELAGGPGGTIDLGPSAINASPDPKRRGIPRPSSVHPGVVNVFFCDGHGRTLSEKIDPGVYARLVTSAGGRHGQAKVEEDF